jgi:hypothetical protein
VIILRALKTYYKGFRTDLELENKKCFKDHWILLYQPEKLTKQRQECLNTFLTQYSELIEYRSLTLSLGS